MDRNTILAIVLSVIVITVGFTIQTVFFAPATSDAVASTEQTVETLPSASYSGSASSPVVNSSVGTSAAIGGVLSGSLGAIGDDPSVTEVRLETEVFDIVFTTDGAAIAGMKLKKHLDEGIPVEAIFSDSTKPAAFYLYPGNDIGAPIDSRFSVSRPDQYTVVFSRDFVVIGEDGSTSAPFTIKKTYVFAPEDYLFEIYVEMINSVNQIIPLQSNGYAYTMAFEPQIGPVFTEAPDGRYEYRRFYTYENGKKKTIKLKDNMYSTDALFSWVTLAGKYFSTIAVPDAADYTLTLTQGATENIALTSNMYLSRPVIRSSVNTDVYRFYIGPQLKQDLVIYNDAKDNGFGLSDLRLEVALDSSSWFGWLENVLKWLLGVFYQIIPNYGSAIILLTILIKIVLYPFTHKSFESTARLQALNPQMEELKAKYKDNTAKLNQEMADLYKREKVNPMGGCLPMLLQFPIFIALYGLLNKHFELRGAIFIPGWISDLSAPETIWNFSPVNIPFLGSDLRLLPILYVITMIFSMKISQSGAAGATGQAAGMNKMFTYFMPIMFFFVLYNAPSGLILYWTVMNLVTMLQQQITNRIKKAQMAKGPSPATSSGLKIVKPEGKKAVSTQVSGAKKSGPTRTTSGSGKSGQKGPRKR